MKVDDELLVIHPPTPRIRHATVHETANDMLPAIVPLTNAAQVTRHAWLLMP